MVDTHTKKYIHFHVSCHCYTFQSTFTLPTTALPLKSSICHCELCRRSSGFLFATFAVIPLPTKPNCAGLTGFDSSKDLTRWFCNTCGCSIWNDDRGNNEWDIASGIISGVTYSDEERADIRASRGPGSPEGKDKDMDLIDGLLDRVQLWVGSTGDGGGAIWINDGKQKDSKRVLEDRSSASVDDDTLFRISTDARTAIDVRDIKPSAPDANDKLAAYCACGKINILISRPQPGTKQADDDDDGDHHHHHHLLGKYPAGLDACWSCRKSSGFEISSWATMPPDRFRWAATGEPVTLDEDVWGRYRTTPAMTRYFCTGCGAIVFCDNGRLTWDIATGLLGRAEHGQGARVESWLAWVKYGDLYLQYREDEIDRWLGDGLVSGVKKDQMVYDGTRNVFIRSHS